MSLADRISEERGTTLVELLVGLMVGMIVLAALTMAIVVTLHGSARVSTRVEATQRARWVVTRIVEELHSACVAPQIAPIQGESTGTSLSFVHATGAQTSVVSPTPTKTVISLKEGVLSQSDYAATGGASPSWTFSTTASSRQLLTNVAPAPPSGSIFSYYKYVNGALSETPLPTPLGAEAAVAIAIKVALRASPISTPVADASAGSTVQDSAVLRLTPPSFNEGAAALPCQ